MDDELAKERKKVELLKKFLHRKNEEIETLKIRLEVVREAVDDVWEAVELARIEARAAVQREMAALRAELTEAKAVRA